MKKLGDMLIRKEAFSEFVIGNTALARAMVESHVRVVTSYPGSPTPEIATAIKSIDEDERPFYFEYSTNEKVATEVAFGASINGHTSCVFFKSVGLNVAADTFVNLSLVELIGGMVIVLGDDPGANSSQNEQDNRHYALMTYMPVFEPSSPEEAYLMFKEAVRLSKEKKMPVIVRMTTHVCHAKQEVSFDTWQPGVIERTPLFDKKNGPYFPLVNLVYPLKRKALQKLDEMTEYADGSEFNFVIDNNNKDYGVIIMGTPYLTLTDMLSDKSVSSMKPDILKLGMIYPIPMMMVIDFLKSHSQVKIIEELDDVIEKEIKMLAYDQRIDTPIIGKIDHEDRIGEYVPDRLIEILHKTWPAFFTLPEKPVFEVPQISGRPAQMCPGCGHRSAFYAIKKALSDIDVITVADIGCHLLGFMPPYDIGEVLMSMGHSTGTGAGLSLFNDKKKIVTFLGDSTFYHAGFPGIVNAVFNKHDMTLVVMENGTTAMTGHQNHPGSGKNFNAETNIIQIKDVLAGLGITNIRETDAYNQKKLIGMVKEAVNEDGFSVIIARHPCMLKFTREQRKAGTFKNKKVHVDQATCQRVRSCISEFACPAYHGNADGKIVVNEELCIGDGSCIRTCPEKSIGFKKEQG